MTFIKPFQVSIGVKMDPMLCACGSAKGNNTQRAHILALQNPWATAM